MHYYERTIIEIKNEYTEMLLNIMVPLVYEAFRATYDKAIIWYNNNKNNSPQLTVIKSFQSFLRDIKTMNNNEIEIECTRIKVSGKCVEYFDKLVCAVFKSYIILLTYNTAEENSYLIKDRYYEKMNVNTFIHTCYIETANIFYNNPYLFCQEYTQSELKENLREINKIIKESIITGIRKSLPIKLILKEYIKNDFVKEKPIIENIKPKIDFDISKQHIYEENIVDPNEELAKDNGTDNLRNLLQNKLNILQNTNILADENENDNDNLLQNNEKKMMK